MYKSLLEDYGLKSILFNIDYEDLKLMTSCIGTKIFRISEKQMKHRAELHFMLSNLTLHKNKADSDTIMQAESESIIVNFHSLFRFSTRRRTTETWPD